MENIEKILSKKPNYLELLGRGQAEKLLKIFSDIENGKYDKEKFYSLHLKGMKYPIYIRSIKADMQSFINTFIEPYLEPKPYFGNMQFIIDAGANIGYTASLFANYWPSCKIISIEPDRENYEFTIKNTVHYRNVKVLNAALWDKNTQLCIEAGQEDGFVVRDSMDETKIPAENMVQGISLKHIMENYNMEKIDLLKMNIEGSEKEIFSGNDLSWLPKVQNMLVELHDGKNPGSSKAVFKATNQSDLAVTETSPYGILFSKEEAYCKWYKTWYKESIYEPNINKARFPKFYLD
jgi:FkbM family methyltransferase